MAHNDGIARKQHRKAVRDLVIVLALVAIGTVAFGFSTLSIESKVIDVLLLYLISFQLGLEAYNNLKLARQALSENNPDQTDDEE